MLVVAYDITDDRRRTRLHTLLLTYGTPVQESIFECELEMKQEREMRRRIARIVRPARDSVRFYRLCATCAERVEDVSGVLRQAPQDTIVV